MRGAQWAGLGIIALGLGSYGMAWSMARSDAEARRVAIAQQSYVEGTCTITDSEVIDWRHDKPDEVTRGATIETTLTVHAPKGDVKDATYRYSDDYFMPLAAKQAVQTTHKRGASITCFYDAADPEKVVLVKRGVPTEEPTSPWLFGSLFAIPCFIAGLIGLLVKPDGKKRDD